MCECIFHQFAVKNVSVNVVIMIYCQHNWIFLRQKKIISIHYLTGQNRGLSGLKNIWPVIMTGNLLSVICSPDNHKKLPAVIIFKYNKQNLTIPNFFGVNVTARSTMSIGVVRHKMYRTDSLRISVHIEINIHHYQFCQNIKG